MRPTLDEIFEEEDPYGLLVVRERARGLLSPEDVRHADAVREVNAFYEVHGRMPDGCCDEHEEMRLGTIWGALPNVPTEAMVEADRNRLLGYGHPQMGASGASTLGSTPSTVRQPEPGWRDEPEEGDVPESLDEIFDEDDEPLPEAAVHIRHVTRAVDRERPAHRADLYPCRDFDMFVPKFVEMQQHLDEGRRVALPVEDGQEIDLVEGGYFIHRGLMAYVAENTELSRRGGKPDFRLRIVFSNGMELDPLMSSFRKALAADRTARVIQRPGFGPLDTEWQADSVDVTGTIYVARSRSEEPNIKAVRSFLHKIGVTSQEVQRRIADARNDPTFLLAEVEIVATYELHNLSRAKVERLLHRFFDAARPSDLYISDRFGKSVRPREWFYVLPEHVSRAVDLIREGTLHMYSYDPARQEIVARP